MGVMFQTIAQQVAARIRQDLLNGRWSETLPGRDQLSKELNINHKTVTDAVVMLEKEGFLVNQGPGCKRRIRISKTGYRKTALRVAFLHLTPPNQTEPWILAMQQRLLDIGHRPFSARKSLTELRMDASRVARMVKSTDADAWLVSAGSKDVLEWFAKQKVPTFCFAGVRHGIPLPGTGPDKVPPFVDATRHLLELGHSRISLLCRRQVRLPQPAKAVQAFLEELEGAGIDTGPFNLPDWAESGEGFSDCLESLFKVTPPTALILDEPFLFHAGFHYLARKGLRVPEDVSLICTDPDPTFAWCRPTVAHVNWDHNLVVRRFIRWINNLAAGKEDRRQTFTKAEYVRGETVGPAPSH